MTFNFQNLVSYDPYTCKNSGQRSVRAKDKEWKQSDMTDRITFPANVVGKKSLHNNY